MNNKTEHKAPKFQMIPTEHFHIKGIKEAFDLSGLVPLYIHIDKNIDEILRDTKYEFTIGRATYIYSVSLDNIINLITGWVGNRNKVKVCHE